MNEKKLKPYGDLMIVTGQYVKDGKTRNRYHKIGTMFASPHLSNLSIKLDSLPVNGEGWVKVFKRDDWVEPDIADTSAKDLEANMDNTIGEDINNVPF